MSEVKALGEESREYYIHAPIFLTRVSESQEHYQNLLGSNDMAIYLAFIEKKPVGFMSVRRNKELRFIDYATPKQLSSMRLVLT
jgi:hypothetical protein